VKSKSRQGTRDRETRGKDKVERDKGQGTRDRETREKDKVESSGGKSASTLLQVDRKDFSPEVESKNQRALAPLSGGLPFGLGGSAFS
jgi:hypothetical protein